MPPLTKERWEAVANQFQERANFPHCLGAVDGKHIEIVNPVGSLYFNYKGYSSVVLMAVADADYQFLFADVGSYGKDHDSTIFRRTSLWQAIENDTIELPEPKPISESREKVVPYFLIGDDAFAMHKHLLKPYGGHGLSLKQRIFNYRICRARRFVECTFGILSNKFRIFHRPINLDPAFATVVIEACVVLHNFIRVRDGYNIEDTTCVVGLQDLNQGNVTGQTGPVGIRNELAEYFLTDEGALSWQLSKV